MAIFFSNQYVVEDNPKRPIVCAPAIFMAQVIVKAVWPRETEGC